MVGRGHRRFPGGALVEFAVAHHVDDAGGVALEPQAQGHADGEAEAVAQGAAGDFHAGGVGAHPGHRQPGVVGPVGVQLLDREDAGLGQRGVLGDRVVAHGQQHPVPALPVRVLGAVGGQVLVDHGEDVGEAEALADVALALHLAHVQDVVPDAVGGGGQVGHPGAPVNCLRHCGFLLQESGE